MNQARRTWMLLVSITSIWLLVGLIGCSKKDDGGPNAPGQPPPGTQSSPPGGAAPADKNTGSPGSG